MNKKLSKNNRFTKVEMQIVVAIIAILIAISIPMFTAALERTRHAVDDANRRDAISLGNIEYLTNQNNSTFMTAVNSSDGAKYVYVVDETGTDKDYQGHLVPDASKGELGNGVTPKCTGSGTDECTADYKTNGSSYHLQVVIKKNATSGDIDVTATFGKDG